MPYVTLEDLDTRLLALEDPRGFLGNFPKGAVLDEIQRTPDLFSYIQTVVDKTGSHFVLSGSQNFLLSEKITQSLAGRTAILKLLPFSIEELKPTVHHPQKWETMVFQGGYPRLYDRQIGPADFYPPYISTYIEKDVRQLKNIEDLNSFTNFVKLCAGRTGQVLNVMTLASDAGISPNTAKAWLSVLMASYILYFLQPHYANYNKRLVKSPKLYFYDTGIVCSLLGIEREEQLASHFMRGALFENLIINEFIKHRLNEGKNPNLFYWMNKERKEIDLIIDQGTSLTPVELKSGKTRNTSFFDNLKYWQKLSGTLPENSYVVYGGDENLKTSQGNLVSWKSLNAIFDSTS